jgi:acetolactate synthase-1/2/3 large subunit
MRAAGVEPVPRRPRRPVSDDVVALAAKVLASGEPSALFLGGSAVRSAGLRAAARIGQGTGAKLLCETFPARLQRGAGLPAVERLAYLGEMAQAQLAGLSHLVVVDSKPPVSFFAYPDKPSDLVPAGCEVLVLASPDEDAVGALEELAARVAGGAEPPVAPAARPEEPTGPLTAVAVGDAIGALLPDDAIVCDEGNTAGLWAALATAGAPPHDWLTLTGGAIGQGLPLATGAAIAAPDRPVLCLEADGSAMYTLQALWTQARERLDVTTVVLSNRSYAILNMELQRVGADAPGPKAASMLDLSRPDLDFASLAAGMGVDATRATTGEELCDALRRAVTEPGPHLIDAVLA